ncbi:anion transporter, partial [Clostridium perfringens]|nr:anion transporter [Clostridium perfringens]
MIAITLALISSLLSTPQIEYIDFKVLILLFNLMIVVAAFKELKVLDWIATYLLSKCKTSISLSFTLVFLTFFASMLVTNDVALITFIPLSLVLGKKSNLNTLNLIVFQTLAA